ncbi:hypothetical protein [Peribacillus simplex]|uniref:hypothetical protein n=1 Tax=Peribacillus simplex TaxID=1478 RepID=UPI003D277F43
MSDASDLIKDFQNLVESADETELSVLSRIVSGLKAKREQRKRSCLLKLIRM